MKGLLPAAFFLDIRDGRGPVIVLTCLAVLLLALSAWLGHANLQSAEAYEVVADNVRSAELAAETLVSSLKDAETAQRGYLLTGDANYLEPYWMARARLDQDYAQLEHTPLASPDRMQRINHIQALSALKLDELGRTVALYQSGRSDAALDLVRTNQGKAIMDAIRVDIDALQQDAAAQLRQTTARTESIRPWGEVISLAMLASVLLGAVALLQRRSRLQIAGGLCRLERFTHAFGLTQGMMRGLDGRIIFWSHGAQRLYGYLPEQAIGRISHELLRSVFPQPLPEIEATLRRDGHWQGELAHIHADGNQLFVASHWALHRGVGGEADAVIEINNDITDLKHAEADLRESELKLRLALDASSQGVWQWELAGSVKRILWDARCKVFFGLTEDAPIDNEAWPSTLVAEDRAAVEDEMRRALDPANPDDEYASEHRVVHGDGSVVWIVAAGRALFEPDPAMPAGRRPVRIVGTMRDVSIQKQKDLEQERANALLRAIVETAPALIYAKDLQSRMLLANAPVMEVIGKPWNEVEGRCDGEFLDDQAQAMMIRRNDRRVMEQGRIEKLEELVSGADGQARVWMSIKAPMRDENKQVIGLVGISLEITEQKRAQHRLQLMVNELNHRVKNTLATVQAITTQTLRGLDPALRQGLDARLLALASAHDVLTQEKWERAPLAVVVSEALQPFDGWDAARFWVSGPQVFLRPAAVLAIAMGLHELATNAVKFGALSVPSGRVEIRWDITDDDAALLRLRWTERDGPDVMPPERRGFGVRLLERTLAQNLRGTTRLRFDDPRGVVCLIEAPLAEVIATPETMSLPRVGRL